MDTGFDWPGVFYGDLASTEAAYRDVITTSWRNRDWTIRCHRKCVLDDSSPILISSFAKIIDGYRASAAGFSPIDRWTGSECLWQLHWFLEGPEIYRFIEEDRCGFLEWLIDGMEHLWVCVALLGDTVRLTRAYQKEFYPGDDRTIRSPIVERLLRAYSRAIPKLLDLEGRIATATSAGVVLQPTTSRLGLLYDLMMATGRYVHIKPSIFTCPLSEISSTLLDSLQSPPGDGIPFPLPIFKL